MKSLFVLIVLISLYKTIICVDFQDCGSVDGKVTSVTVSDCSSGDSVCKFTQGTSASINVKFTSNVDSSSATAKVIGIIGGAPVPFPLNPSDGCKMGMDCPVKSGSSQELKVSMAVSSAYPKINLQVKLFAVDSNGKNLFCTQFPAQIV